MTDPNGSSIDPNEPLTDEVLADAFAMQAESSVEGEVEAEVESEAIQVENDLDLVAMAKERDDYLDALRRLQADFENYKKRMVRQQTENLERAAESLVEKLLPVLDTVDLAVSHGADGAEQVRTALHDVLAKEGLERLDPTGKPFDPNEHDAVMHEDGDGGPHVSEVLRAGYRYKGRVLRPAMVKVTG